MPEFTQEQLDKAHLRVHFKEWAKEVRAFNVAQRIPELLIEDLDPHLESYAKEVLESLGLTHTGKGYWEKK